MWSSYWQEATLWYGRPLCVPGYVPVPGTWQHPVAYSSFTIRRTKKFLSRVSHIGSKLQILYGATVCSLSSHSSTMALVWSRLIIPNIVPAYGAGSYDNIYRNNYCRLMSSHVVSSNFIKKRRERKEGKEGNWRLSGTTSKIETRSSYFGGVKTLREDHLNLKYFFSSKYSFWTEIRNLVVCRAL